MKKQEENFKKAINRSAKIQEVRITGTGYIDEPQLLNQVVIKPQVIRAFEIEFIA